MLSFRQQIVAPRYRVAQRLLPGGDVAGALREQRQRVPEPGEEGVGVERADHRGRELDGQGEPIQAPADRGDGRGAPLAHVKAWVGHLRSFDEQSHRIQLRQVLDG